MRKDESKHSNSKVSSVHAVRLSVSYFLSPPSQHITLVTHTPLSEDTVVYLMNSFLGNDRYKRVRFVTVFCNESSVSVKCRLFTDAMLLRS